MTSADSFTKASPHYQAATRSGLNVKTDGGFEVPGQSIGRGIANLFGVLILMGVSLAALTACVLPFVFIALVLS